MSFLCFNIIIAAINTLLLYLINKIKNKERTNKLKIYCYIFLIFCIPICNLVILYYFAKEFLQQ